MQDTRRLMIPIDNNDRNAMVRQSVNHLSCKTNSTRVGCRSVEEISCDDYYIDSRLRMDYISYHPLYGFFYIDFSHIATRRFRVLSFTEDQVSGPCKS